MFFADFSYLDFPRIFNDCAFLKLLLKSLEVLFLQFSALFLYGFSRLGEMATNGEDAGIFFIGVRFKNFLLFVSIHVCVQKGLY